MYYDNKWVEKQERGSTRWLNFILTPQVGSLPQDWSCEPQIDPDLGSEH